MFEFGKISCFQILLRTLWTWLILAEYFQKPPISTLNKKDQNNGVTLYSFSAILQNVNKQKMSKNPLDKILKNVNNRSNYGLETKPNCRWRKVIVYSWIESQSSWFAWAQSKSGNRSRKLHLTLSYLWPKKCQNFSFCKSSKK